MIMPPIMTGISLQLLNITCATTEIPQLMADYDTHTGFTSDRCTCTTVIEDCKYLCRVVKVA